MRWLDRRRMARLCAAALLALVATGAFQLRKRLIRAIFRDGRPRAAAPLSPATGTGVAPLSPAPRLRVVLLDGLGAPAARALPALSALCARGLDLEVDVGFPTVSLPVQAVLWTGRTQQQSGIRFHTTRMPLPPAGALPQLVPGSRGVAEAHAEIVNSFGFATAQPPDVEKPPPWGEADFSRAALDAVASEAPLVFLHVLRIDAAGHAAGAASAAYREAMRTADELLGRVIARDAEVHGATSRWLVLADHGHLPAGGHGDAEESLLIVRACIAGGVPGDLVGPWGARVHLVDISRAMFDSLGVAPNAESVGRPLAAAVREPAPRATLPSPEAWRWAVAALLLLAGAIASLGRDARRARWRWLGLPGLWWWVATASLWAIAGTPSLSRNYVFRSWTWVAWQAMAPGLLVLLLVDGLALWRGATLGAALRRALGLPLALVLGALVLCHGEAVLGAADPPLMPFLTGLASAWLALFIIGTAALALSALAAAARAGSGPRAAAGTSDTGG